MTSTRLPLALAALGVLSAIDGAGQTTPATRPYVAIGCVSVDTTGSPGANATGLPEFIITDMRGNPPLVYRLEGDAKLLKLHVGHTVEVSGPLSPAAKTATGADRAVPTMTVQSLTWIATSCREAKKD